MAKAIHASPAHTAGPWVYQQSTKTIRGPGNHWIATMDSFDGAVNHDANARPIVAAPELFEHLKNIVEMAHSVSANCEKGDLALAVRNLDRIATAAETSIAKAKVRSLSA